MDSSNFTIVTLINLKFLAFLRLITYIYPKITHIFRIIISKGKKIAGEYAH